MAPGSINTWINGEVGTALDSAIVSLTAEIIATLFGVPAGGVTITGSFLPLPDAFPGELLAEPELVEVALVGIPSRSPTESSTCSAAKV